MFSLVLLFWAWQSGHWLAGVVAAIWLEWALKTPRQWALSNKNVKRIVDLTSLALITVALYQYSSGPLAQTISAILHWAPLLFLPLLSVQLLSGRKGLERRALFYFQHNTTGPLAKRTVDLVFPYIAACLIAASQDTVETSIYYPGLVLFIAWLLWWYRPRHRRMLVWGLLLSLAVALGYLGQLGLRQAHAQLEEAVIGWLSSFYTGSTDPYKARTALGDIGNLKLSDRILYRVETEEPLQQALLLRSAAYNRYIDTTWFSRHRDFTPQQPSVYADVWQWMDTRNPADQVRSARISAYLEDKQSILPLPTGSWRIENLPVSSLSRNKLGALRVGEGPALVRYLMRFDRASATDAPPEEADLRVPKREQLAIQGLAKALELAGMRPNEAMRRLRDYFQQQFRYTLDLPGKVKGQTALSHFLLERRAGHCEYFASATVLLLRQAGIPARYAVGYSTQEASDRPNQYIVRNSHAHAWSLVWHKGRWWDLDTTPSIWFSVEADDIPLWQPLLDLLSDLYYQFVLHQLDPHTGNRSPWLWGLLGVLFLALGYRLRPGRAFRRSRKQRLIKAKQQLITPLGSIAAVFDQAGFPKSHWETYGSWLQRLRRQPGLAEVVDELEEIRRLHYRLRYRSAGLNSSEYRHMQHLAEDWLKRWNQTSIRRHIDDSEQEQA